MDLFKAIYSRRSVRKYSKKKVSKDDLMNILDAGIYAPSACDIQGWRFIVIDDPKVKQELMNEGAASFIESAPIGILVLYNNQTENLEYMDYLQSAAACIQNMLLAAHSLGIGCCWICHLPRKGELRNLLCIPKHYDPIAYITLGYPKGDVKERKRRYDVNDLISYNRYESKKDSVKSTLRLSIKRLMRKIYYRLPFRKHIKTRVDDRFEKRFD
ncbi:MAG: nitroreductase family protein [Candidatus Altiarchaeota archaeon]|nr:nitroreductase family protein [Candidatus Altiarchaeota archaeon]